MAVPNSACEGQMIGSPVKGFSDIPLARRPMGTTQGVYYFLR